MNTEVFHSHSSTSIQIADRFIAAQRKITVHKFVNECVAPLARTKASPSEVRLAASSSKMMARRDARIKSKGGGHHSKKFFYVYASGIGEQWHPFIVKSNFINQISKTRIMRQRGVAWTSDFLSCHLFLYNAKNQKRHNRDTNCMTKPRRHEVSGFTRDKERHCYHFFPRESRKKGARGFDRNHLTIQ